MTPDTHSQSTAMNKTLNKIVHSAVILRG